MLKRIHHAGVIVRDMERSLNFYRDVLGMALRYHIVGPSSEIAMLTIGNQGEVHTAGPLNMDSEAIELICRENNDAAQRSRGQVDHLCFSVGNLDVMIEKLRDEGYVTDETPGEFAAAKSRIFFFKGPDNEIIELWEDEYSKD